VSCVYHEDDAWRGDGQGRGSVSMPHIIVGVSGCLILIMEGGEDRILLGVRNHSCCSSRVFRLVRGIYSTEYMDGGQS
jgi:hypothetical protein